MARVLARERGRAVADGVSEDLLVELVELPQALLV
jgi:hypothetical protein